MWKKIRVEFSSFDTKDFFVVAKELVEDPFLAQPNSDWEFHENKINDLLRSFFGPLHTFQAAASEFFSSFFGILLFIITTFGVNQKHAGTPKWRYALQNQLIITPQKMTNCIFVELISTQVNGKPLSRSVNSGLWWHIGQKNWLFLDINSQITSWSSSTLWMVTQSNEHVIAVQRKLSTHFNAIR